MPPTSFGYRTVKRTLDVVLATVGILALAPVLAAVAVCVWLDDPKAPLLFRQRRCGRGGRSFRLLKFRTMVKDADRLKEQLRSQSLVAWPDFRLVDDPRVTRVGRILRKTSLDELPQFLNVIKGDMSLVGPRPTSFDVTTYRLWQTSRLDVRPGITGPWQVHGRNSMDFDERCRLEITYFRQPSLWRDLRLLPATALSMLNRTGVA